MTTLLHLQSNNPRLRRTTHLSISLKNLILSQSCLFTVRIFNIRELRHDIVPFEPSPAQQAKLTARVDNWSPHLCLDRDALNPSPHHASIVFNLTYCNRSLLTHPPPPDLPPVKPSAIALGTVFNHAASLAILGPVFGDTYHRALSANSKEEFVKSKEAASAAAAWGTSLVGSAVQSYGVGALINATGTLSYKGAAYLGSLIFFASSAPSVWRTYITH